MAVLKYVMCKDDKTNDFSWNNPQHWYDHPPANPYGIICGPATGIIVIDVDMHGTDTRAATRAADALLSLINTYVVQSPSGGYHFYFYCDDVDEFPPTSCRITDLNNNVVGDLKASGYVVGPGSVTRFGTYEVISPVVIARWDPDLIGSVIRVHKTEDDIFSSKNDKVHKTEDNISYNKDISNEDNLREPPKTLAPLHQSCVLQSCVLDEDIETPYEDQRTVRDWIIAFMDRHRLWGYKEGARHGLMRILATDIEYGLQRRYARELVEWGKVELPEEIVVGEEQLRAIHSVFYYAGNHTEGQTEADSFRDLLSMLRGMKFEGRTYAYSVNWEAIERDTKNAREALVLWYMVQQQIGALKAALKNPRRAPYVVVPTREIAFWLGYKSNRSAAKLLKSLRPLIEVIEVAYKQYRYRVPLAIYAPDYAILESKYEILGE